MTFFVREKTNFKFHSLIFRTPTWNVFFNIVKQTYNSTVIFLNHTSVRIYIYIYIRFQGTKKHENRIRVGQNDLVARPRHFRRAEIGKRNPLLSALPRKLGQIFGNKTQKRVRYHED